MTSCFGSAGVGGVGRAAVQTEVVTVQELGYVNEESSPEQTSQVVGFDDGLCPIEHLYGALRRVIAAAVLDAVGAAGCHRQLHRRREAGTVAQIVQRVA